MTSQAAVTKTTGEVIQGAFGAVQEVGTGAVRTTKGVVIGVVQGIGEVATVTVGVVSDTVRAAIKGTSAVGTDTAACGQRHRRGSDHRHEGHHPEPG